MGEDMQKPEALCTAVGMENATATWGPVWWVLRKLNLEQPDKPAIPLLGLQPEALTAETGIDPCPSVHGGVVPSRRRQKQHQRPWGEEWVNRGRSHTPDYPSALKRKDVLTRATTWVDLEGLRVK